MNRYVWLNNFGMAFYAEYDSMRKWNKPTLEKTRGEYVFWFGPLHAIVGCP